MMMVDFVHLIFFIYQFEYNQSLELSNKKTPTGIFFKKFSFTSLSRLVGERKQENPEKNTVLGPLLFSLYINDTPVGNACQIRLFADDCVCYREIKTVEGTLKLQKDIDLSGSWKRINKIEASYTLEGTVLGNDDSIYLDVTITNDLKWNTHITNICTYANSTLGFLRRNLFSCPQDIQEAAYK